MERPAIKRFRTEETLNSQQATCCMVASELVTGYQARLRENEDQSVEYTTQIKSYRQQLEELKRRYDYEMKKMEKDRQNYDNILEGFHHDLERQKAEIAALKNAGSCQFESPATTEVENLKKKIAFLEQQCSHLKQRNDQLVEAAKQSEKASAKRIGETTERAQILEKQVEKLDADLKMERNRMAELEKSIEDKERTINNSVPRRKLEIAQKDRDTWSMRCQDLEKRYQDSKNDRDSLTTRYGLLEKRYQDSKNAFNKVKADLESSKKDLELTTKKLDESTVGCNRMHRSFATLSHVKKRLPNVLQSLKEIKTQKAAIEKDVQTLFVTTREEFGGTMEQVVDFVSKIIKQQSVLREEVTGRLVQHLETAAKEKMAVDDMLKREKDNGRTPNAEFESLRRQWEKEKMAEFSQIIEEKQFREEEIRHLSQRLESTDKEKAAIEELLKREQDKVRAGDAKFQSFRQRWEKEKADKHAELVESSRQIIEKHRVLESLRMDLTESQKRAGEFSRRSKEMEEMLEKARKELNEEKSKMRGRDEEISRQLKEKDEQIRGWEQTKIGLSKELDKLKQEIAALKESQSKSENVKKENHDEALRALNDQLREKTDRLTNLQNTLGAMNAERENFERQVADYKKVVAELRKKEKQTEERIMYLDLDLSNLKDEKLTFLEQVKQAEKNRNVVNDQVNRLRVVVANYIEVAERLKSRIDEYVQGIANNDIRVGSREWLLKFADTMDAEFKNATTRLQ